MPQFIVTVFAVAFGCCAIGCVSRRIVTHMREEWNRPRENENEIQIDLYSSEIV